MAAAKDLRRAASAAKRPPRQLKVAMVSVAHKSEGSSGVSIKGSPGQVGHARVGDAKRKRRKMLFVKENRK